MFDRDDVNYMLLVYGFHLRQPNTRQARRLHAKLRKLVEGRIVLSQLRTFLPRQQPEKLFLTPTFNPEIHEVGTEPD